MFQDFFSEVPLYLSASVSHKKKEKNSIFHNEDLSSTHFPHKMRAQNAVQ